MLKNVPDYEGLNNAALSQYFFAWERTLSIESVFQEAHFDEETYEEERIKYVEQSQRDLRVYYTIIQQSNELALKARLCRVSPYLLLIGSENRFSFNTEDIEFSDLRTLNAVDLIGAVNSLTEQTLSSEFQTLYNALRVRRNAMLHLDASLEVLDPDDVLHTLIKIYLELWPERNWLADRVLFGSHSSDAYFDDGENFTILGSVIREWSTIYHILTKGEFKNLFGISKSQRRYICFQCLQEAKTDWDDWDFSEVKFAYLINEDNLHCLICDSNFQVTRKPCAVDHDCEGDVISHANEDFAEQCHTCSYHPSEI